MNIYRDDDGKWQSYVYVRREMTPELVVVIDRSPGAIELNPDTRFAIDAYGRMRLLEPKQQAKRGSLVVGGSFTAYTRIYMGIVPPTGHEPGYVAVVGELFDGTYEPKHRSLFVIDEGVCFPNIDPSDALLSDLMKATSALKDLYMPGTDIDESTDNMTAEELELLDMTNRSSASGLGGDRRLIMSAGHPLFLEEVRKFQHGICSYPDEEDLPLGRTKARYPFFVSRDRIAPLYEPPWMEDEEYGMKTVTTMMNRVDEETEKKMLRHHECCTVLSSGQYKTPLRAVAMCCLSLQTYDWTEALEGRFDYDGYPTDQDEEEVTSRERVITNKRSKYIDGLIYLASDRMDRQIIEREGIKGFLRAIGAKDGM